MVRKRIKVKFYTWIDKEGHKKIAIVGKNF